MSVWELSHSDSIDLQLVEFLQFQVKKWSQISFQSSAGWILNEKLIEFTKGGRVLILNKAWKASKNFTLGSTVL